MGAQSGDPTASTFWIRRTGVTTRSVTALLQFPADASFPVSLVLWFGAVEWTTSDSSIRCAAPLTGRTENGGYIATSFAWRSRTAGILSCRPAPLLCGAGLDFHRVGQRWPALWESRPTIRLDGGPDTGHLGPSGTQRRARGVRRPDSTNRQPLRRFGTAVLQTPELGGIRRKNTDPSPCGTGSAYCAGWEPCLAQPRPVMAPGTPVTSAATTHGWAADWLGPTSPLPTAS